MKTSNYDTIQNMLENIEDPAIRMVASHSLKIAREELDRDFGSGQQKQNVADQIDGILNKAMHQRKKNAPT